MKNKIKLLGIIAIVAIIAACDSGTNDPCASGHTFPSWIAPSCTENGNSVRTCINCTQTDTRTTGYAALGHEGLTPGVAATCTEAGSSESGNCTRPGCGQIVTETVIPALGHQGLTPAFAATCTTAGNSQASGTCSRPGCGQVITGTVIPALFPELGHDHIGSLICKRIGCNHQYALGDLGPTGGRIFHINPTGFTVQGYSAGTGATAHLNFTDIPLIILKLHQ